MTPLLLHPATARTATDEQLVQALRCDAHGAFDAVFARYEQPLLGYARKLLGGAHHDAEECVQDAFVRATSSLAAHPEREIALKAWLYTIVRNACLDRLRARTTRPQVELQDAGPDLWDRGADPHLALARREDLRAVVVALQALPDRQRTALVQHELEGRSHADVARDLGVSEGASKALVHRARAGLHAAQAA